MRYRITADGNQNVPVPLGKSFSLACSGTFGGATVTAQYNSGIAGVAAIGTLTGTTIAVLDVVRLGDITYTFVNAFTDPVTANEILVGASDSDSLDNLIAAINGAAGEGTTYSTGTEANALATALAGTGDTLDVTAIDETTAGNSIITTSTLTAGGWAEATLTGGEDATDRFKPFATTAIALSAAGEKTGINCGAHHEINLATTSSSGTTDIIAVVNVLPD